MSFRLLISTIFLICFMIFSKNAISQNLAYFFDQQERLIVFDNGDFHKLEHLEVSDIRLGGNYLIYLDPLDQRKRYYNGKSEILDIAPSMSYGVSQYYLIDQSRSSTVVRYDNKMEKVGLADVQYSLGDSVLAFIDFKNVLNIHYQGKSEEVSNLGTTIKEMKASDNSVAFLTNRDLFFFYHDGLLEEIYHQAPMSYHIGNNFLVYVDEYETFVVYENGEFEELETFELQSYKGGDNILAYVTNRNVFKVYWNGEIKELSPDVPQRYEIKDNTLMYIDERGFLNVFYKGENHLLEYYTPQKIKMFEGIVAYTDLDGRLKAFYEGEKVKISELIVEDFDVQGRVIVFYQRNGEPNIYFDKKYFNY